MMTPAEIVRILGGTGKTAAALGVTSPAVSNWLARGRVPSFYAPAIIAAAKERRPESGVDLTYEDLLE